MTISDIAVLGSILCLAIGITQSIWFRLKDDTGKEIVPQEWIFISFLCLASSILFRNEDPMLFRALTFGVITGLSQPLLADSYLVKKTLAYRREGPILLETPLWMFFLWGISMSHIAYLFMRFFYKQDNSYLIFLAIVVFYFLVFELVVGNVVKWWVRRDCWQVLNVAIYAVVAESIIAIITAVTLTLFDFSNQFWLLVAAAISAVAIALDFVFFCFIFWWEYQAKQNSPP